MGLGTVWEFFGFFFFPVAMINCVMFLQKYIVPVAILEAFIRLLGERSGRQTDSKTALQLGRGPGM